MPIKRSGFIRTDSIPKLVHVRCVYRITFDDGRFYIGSTNDLQRRLNKWRQKLTGGVYNKKIKFFVKNKFSCKADVLEYVEDRSKLLEREDWYIQRNRVNPLLLNRVKGAYFGDTCGLTTKEKRARIGKKLTPEQSKRLSDARRGLKHTIYHAAQIKETARRISGKPINQYTKEGFFVKQFRCAGDAADELKIRLAAIRKVLYDGKLSAGGFVFKQVGKDQTIKKAFDNRKRIIQLSKSGNAIREFESIKEAVQQTGIDRMRIYRACTGKKKEDDGIYFKYA